MTQNEPFKPIKLPRFYEKKMLMLTRTKRTLIYITSGNVTWFKSSRPVLFNTVATNDIWLFKFKLKLIKTK